MVIARRKDKLEELIRTIPYPVNILSLDLTDRNSFIIYDDYIKANNLKISLLINCSGYGHFGATDSIEYGNNLNMVDLNCQAIVALCQISLQYMDNNSKIINIASVAGFQPVPYMNLYAATKAFVISYSRGLNRELKNRNICVTAVCPLWTKTEFFEHAVDNDNIVVKKYNVLFEPKDVVNRAMRDSLHNRDISVYGFITRLQRFIVKFVPHGIIMNYWLKEQKL